MLRNWKVLAGFLLFFTVLLIAALLGSPTTVLKIYNTPDSIHYGNDPAPPDQPMAPL